MYKSIIRPILFKFQPETIHHFIVDGMKIFFKIPGISSLTRCFLKVEDKRLNKTVFGIDFPNPVGFAAGFDKNAEVFNHLRNFGFGFVEIGTVTPKPQSGNPKPRCFRIVEDEGIINRMGFNNEGVDAAVARIRKQNNKVIIGGNIGKNTATANENALADYEYCFEALYDYVDYFVINVSCPNVKDLRKLQDTESLSAIISSLTGRRANKSVYKPILMKISPDLTQVMLDETIELVMKSGLDGFVATNTSTSREGLKTNKERIEEIANGGLSGMPIKNRSTEIIRYIANKTNKSIPIIGVGGIHTPNDAIEKLEAGASLIQVYTGFIFEGPGLVKKINKEILKRHI
ncbi:MAG: quinone-dependent dihydroorotate dehydrogenase [Bacteroidota bacterium]